MKPKSKMNTEPQDEINTVLAVSSPAPYSIMEILPLLVRATEILLYRKDYDGHDYEEMMQAVKFSKQITFKAACAGSAKDKNVSDGLELAEWILKHKRSVFLEADISHELKKDILRKLNYSLDVLH